MRALHLSLAAAAELALTTTLAWAQVAPGTLVSNTIDLSYTSGGSTISVPSAATATFTVDRKIDLNVDGLDSGAIVYAEQAADHAALSYLVQNLGNDTQGFDIDVLTSGTLSLAYDPTGSGTEGTFWVVISDSATPGAGSEVVYDATGTRNAGDLPAGGDYWVHLYVNVSTSAASGQTSSFQVTATALDSGTNTVTTEDRDNGLGGVDTVFADPDADGQEAASETLQINAPELSASKVLTVVSENLDGTFNCASGSPVGDAEAPIPGACLEYTITVMNAPSATLPATDLVIVDPLPSGVTYAGHTNSGFTSVTRSGNTVTGSLASLPPGGTASFRIRVTVAD